MQIIFQPAGFSWKRVEIVIIVACFISVSFVDAHVRLVARYWQRQLLQPTFPGGLDKIVNFEKALF